MRRRSASADIRRFGVAAIAAVLVATPVVAQETGDIEKRLSEIEDDLAAGRAAVISLEQTAESLAAELAALRVQIGAASRTAQRHAVDIARLDEELAVLTDQEDATLRDLATRRAALAKTLAGLQRLALRPQAALLVTPGDPNDVVRSGLLLRTAIPGIESQAAELRDELAALADLRNEIQSSRDSLARSTQGLQAERERLAALQDDKTSVLAATHASREDTASALARLTDEAGSLEELLAALQRQAAEQQAAAAKAAAEAAARQAAAEAAEKAAAEQLARATPAPRPSAPEAAPEATVAVPLEPAPAPAAPDSDQLASLAPPGIASIADARGALTPPALGNVVQNFGDRTEFGSKSDGITYQTVPDALVVAPWDGQVVFADQFRSFGQILIIDHGEGYHSLLAGLARIDAPVGQWVLAGEPVGVAGDPEKPNDGAESASGTDSSGMASRLYVELRHDGQPINPLPWIAASTDKVSG